MVYINVVPSFPITLTLFNQDVFPQEEKTASFVFRQYRHVSIIHSRIESLLCARQVCTLNS